ncbi:MAG TPA: tRNA (adenosine(37)-N6)-threonylcarbamoyltransferase complex transferase subunit TsaD [Candidatus Paceibacterota bacterium]
MKILGIETSCDDSAVCLIEANGTYERDFRFRVLGNALSSQAALHAEYGGVFPNLAKREHAKALVPLLRETLGQADALDTGDSSCDGLDMLLSREPELLEALTPFLRAHARPDIDCIAVTHGPGLEPALWVGINFAKALASSWNVPLVGVNHMEGHIVLSLMNLDGPEHSHNLKIMRVSGMLSELNFPLLSLLISGGHTELVLSRQWLAYERIGETRDDAAGEAFDKVARLMGLPYPGGPEISRLASQARAHDIVADFTFTRPMIKDDNFDFSFSGLKTAVRNQVEKHRQGQGKDQGLSSVLLPRRVLRPEFVMQVAREFEDTVADVLVAKTLRAVDEYGVNTVVVGGGVSANAHIRARLAGALADSGGIQLLIPPPEFATDNALMIALAGYFHAERKEFADPDTLSALGNMRL